MYDCFWMMDWEICGRKVSWSVLRPAYDSRICLERQRKISHYSESWDHNSMRKSVSRRKVRCVLHCDVQFAAKNVGVICQMIMSFLQEISA